MGKASVVGRGPAPSGALARAEPAMQVERSRQTIWVGRVKCRRNSMKKLGGFKKLAVKRSGQRWSGSRSGLTIWFTKATVRGCCAMGFFLGTPGFLGGVFLSGASRLNSLRCGTPGARSTSSTSHCSRFAFLPLLCRFAGTAYEFARGSSHALSNGILNFLWWENAPF
jgi:hypothetical protein